MRFLALLSLKNECHDIFREYILNMYKMVSKTTRDESALIKGTSLACNMCAIFFALDAYYSGADFILIGDNQRAFIDLAQKVSNFFFKKINVKHKKQCLDARKYRTKRTVGINSSRNLGHKWRADERHATGFLFGAIRHTKTNQSKNCQVVLRARKLRPKCRFKFV